MNNESGYMTAFSMIISFLLISVVVSNIRILDSERQFNEQRVSWFKANVTLELARVDVLSGLNSGKIKAEDTDYFSYRYGRVDYQVYPSEKEVVVVRLDVHLKDGGKSIGLLYYDYVNQKVNRWVVV